MSSRCWKCRVVSDERALEQIVARAQRLSREDQLRLVKRIVEMLISAEPPLEPQRIRYSQFRGERMSSEEDFRIADWRPNRQDLNGLVR